MKEQTVPKGQRRVVVTCGTFEPGFRGGGPIRSVSRVIETAPRDVEVWLLTSDRELGGLKPYPGLSGKTIRRGRAKVTYLNKHSPRDWFRVVRALRRRPIDLLYVNGLWEPWLSQFVLLLARIGVLRVRQSLIAPHGELDPGALALKSRKKRLALPIVRLLLGRGTLRWHATTLAEASNICAAIPHATGRVVIVDQPVAAPRRGGPTAPVPGPIRFVFIGRLSPKKNLELALLGLERLSVPAILHIYGPVEDQACWKRCLALMARIPSHVAVRYCGELRPEEVPHVFQRYEAFIFPTLGENFGHVIAESLASWCPVICSDRTPWTEVLNGGGGEVVSALTPPAWSEVLEKWAARSPTARFKSRESAGQAFASWWSNQKGDNILRVALDTVSGRGE